MKRFLVLAMAVILASFAAQANAANMYGGLKGGVNFGDLSDVDDTSMRTGFSGGLFVGTHVNKEFGFRLEGLWVQKGAEDGTGDKWNLDYIEFPLLFVYDLPAGESVLIDLFAGPTLGFNIKSEVESSGVTADVKDETESFEFGAAIGAGIAKKMAGDKALGLDVRYSLGATGLAKDAPSGVDNPKNRGIGLMAFFQIPLGAQE